MQIEKFTIIVDDYDTAIGFFTSVLGFDLVEDSPSLTNDGRPKRWVVVRPPGAQTGLLICELQFAQVKLLHSSISGARPPKYETMLPGTRISEFRQ
jgi:catechol 2,3-dioxygenase-like lactoylglutathione lyase family enzyme